jgi:nucleoid DNA-binding protein
MMSGDAGATPAATEEAPKADVVLEGKKAIYEDIRCSVLEKTGKNIGQSGGMALFNQIVDSIFVEAVQKGTIRLNGGFGSFHIKNYGAGSRTLPSGQRVDFGERQKLRYVEGVVVEALVKNGGNLEEALKAKGSSRKDGSDPPAADPPAAGASDGEVNLD